MREAINERRVQRVIAGMRSAVFAALAFAPGALVFRAMLPLLMGDGYEVAPVLAESATTYAWIGGGTTALLAAIVGWHANETRLAVLLSSIAGCINGPGTSLVLAVVSFLDHRSLDMVYRAVGTALVTSICSAPIGLSIGWLFGIVLLPVVFTFAWVGRRTTITTAPRALCCAAVWCALWLSIVALWGMHGVTTVGAGIAWSIAGLAALEVLRRRRLAARAACGELGGWSVEADEDGTRWLVRETHAGEGAYREGTVRARWGRLDA